MLSAVNKWFDFSLRNSASSCCAGTIKLVIQQKPKGNTYSTILASYKNKIRISELCFQRVWSVARNTTTRDDRLFFLWARHPWYVYGLTGWLIVVTILSRPSYLFLRNTQSGSTKQNRSFQACQRLLHILRLMKKIGDDLSTSDGTGERENLNSSFKWEKRTYVSLSPWPARRRKEVWSKPVSFNVH